MDYSSTFSFENYEYAEDGKLYYVTASGGITTYYPASMYRPNGDPGDPAEGGEVEFDEIHIEDEEGNEVDEDTLAYLPDWLDNMARSEAVDTYDRYDDPPDMD